MEIIFDRMGLIEYPGLGEKVIKPLTERGHKLGMWTRESRDAAAGDLRRLGLTDQFSFIVGKSDMNDMAVAVSKRQCDALKRARSRIGISPAPDLAETITLWQQWIELADGWNTRFKYPPILGVPNALMIDSDLGNSREGPPQRFPGAEDYLKFAERSNISLILMPEHPKVWESQHANKSPEEILEKLRVKLVSWHGEHIVADIGLESGIYA